MRENEVEKAFVDVVKEAGGKAVKFTSQTMNGVPDRLVLLPCGKCAFVELKVPGKRDAEAAKKTEGAVTGTWIPCVLRGPAGTDTAGHESAWRVGTGRTGPNRSRGRNPGTDKYDTAGRR